MAAAPAADRTKVVIRNLPPQAQESDVRALVDEQFQDRITWFCLVQGKIRWVIFAWYQVENTSPHIVLSFAVRCCLRIAFLNKDTVLLNGRQRI